MNSRAAPKGESDSVLSQPAIERPGPMGSLVESGAAVRVSRVWLAPTAKLSFPAGRSNGVPLNRTSIDPSVLIMSSVFVPMIVDGSEPEAWV